MTSDNTPAPWPVLNNAIEANDFSNYIIGSNITNAFAMGKIGSTDDFFLVGAPASGPDTYPLLTGNILGSDGSVLFRLVKNNLNDLARIV